MQPESEKRLKLAIIFQIGSSLVHVEGKIRRIVFTMFFEDGEMLVKINRASSQDTSSRPKGFR